MRKYLTTFGVFLCMVFAGLAAFSATAFAAGAVEPADGSLIDAAKPVYDAIMAGHYLAGTALGLVVLVALIKRYAGTGAFGKLVHSDVGGVVTTFATSLFGAVGTALLAGGSLSWKLAYASGGIALTAAGGFALIKKLIVVPLLKPWEEKASGPTKAVLSVILWIFDKPDLVAAAETAGTAAVAAKPAVGAVAVTGQPTELK